MKKLERLLESAGDDLAAAEKAGWEWLQADEKFVRFLVDHPDYEEAKRWAAANGARDVGKGNNDGDLLWRLAAVAAAFLRGGRANEKGFGMADQDPEQRKLGLEVEAEHTCPDAREDIRALIQGRIGRDHDAERVPGGYYFRGADGEAKVKGEK